MRRSLTFVAAASTIAFTHMASAADLPVKAMPAPAPAIYNWTGFYVGGTVGAAWDHARVDLATANGPIAAFDPRDIPALNALGSPDIDGTNFIAGFKAGYNQQWGAWVLGIEGDISWRRFDGSSTRTANPFTIAPGVPFAAGTATFTTNVQSDWIATIRPRLGYAFNRTLLYGTGGVAFGNVKFSNTYSDFAPLELGIGREASAASETKTGWAAGAGIDYALTQNWILSAEYLHVDLGSITASGRVSSLNPTTANFTFTTKLTTDIARAGLAYKF